MERSRNAFHGIELGISNTFPSKGKPLGPGGTGSDDREE